MVAVRGVLLTTIVLTLILGSSYGGSLRRSFSSDNSSDDDVLSRWKRSPQKTSKSKSKPVQSKGVNLEIDCISVAFEWCQSCCYVPLLPTKESQKRCINREGTVHSSLLHTVRETFMKKYWKGEKKISKPNDFNAKAQHFVGNPAMFVSCVLKDIKIAKDDGRIDTAVLEQVIQSNYKKKYLDNHWDSTALTAARTCQQEAESIPIQQFSTTDGKQTSLIPYAFLLCLRKKLIEGCKSFIDSPGCIKAKGLLQKCKLEDFWRQLQQGGPSPGSGTNSINDDGMSNGDTDKNEMSSTQQPENNNNQGNENNMPQEPPQPEGEPPAEPSPEPAAEEQAPEEQQPAAEEAAPAEEAQVAPEEPQPAAEEEPPAETPNEEPPAEETPAEE
ncbi:Hypothetical predicted protein [Cloeon dipterum]|uniref:Uncharacterized protein n=1 Tax=Cloeon dipterum TaxID=197152 RepID=A0A8S1CGA5_9INSE|nr:Hypothetical predicted protein [Cloeon dipterum]